MTRYYFSKDDFAESKEKTIEYSINDNKLIFLTDTNVFAKNGIDYGSDVLLKTILPLITTGKVLDIGCGYGVIGLTLAYLIHDIEVTCLDINLRAVNLTIKNAAHLQLSKRVTILQSDLYEKLEGKFDHIISNPPIRAGKKVLDKIYLESYDHLNSGGCLYLVVRRKQGAESTISRLKQIYTRVDVINKDKGYWIITASK